MQTLCLVFKNTSLLIIKRTAKTGLFLNSCEEKVQMIKCFPVCLLDCWLFKTAAHTLAHTRPPCSLVRQNPTLNRPSWGFLATWRVQFNNQS